MKLLTHPFTYRATVSLLLGVISILSLITLVENLNTVRKNTSKHSFNRKLKIAPLNKIPTKEKQKVILLWSSPKQFPFNLFEKGDTVFRKYNCAFKCFVTNNRKYFGDITQFDAIAFNGPSLKARDLPKRRSKKQDYIYFNTEPADNYPVCNPVFDNFFNMTATYKLDSDLLFHYFDIHDKTGKVVGPQIDMEWVNEYTEAENKVNVNKTKAVAWFVSNCKARSGRMELAKKLQKSLKLRGLTFDIYGRCGDKTCPKNNKTLCEAMLRKEYYFYYSAENSFCEDYVTEKAMTALLNDVVPIVYGGADYYRFLPPHSYIDSRAYSAEELADLIVELIKLPKNYQSYFRWKNNYKYTSANRGRQICAVCEAINRQPKSQMVYEHFRKWWYPKFHKRC